MRLKQLKEDISNLFNEKEIGTKLWAKCKYCLMGKQNSLKSYVRADKVNVFNIATKIEYVKFVWLLTFDHKEV